MQTPIASFDDYSDAPVNRYFKPSGTPPGQVPSTHLFAACGGRGAGQATSQSHAAYQRNEAFNSARRKWPATRGSIASMNRTP